TSFPIRYFHTDREGPCPGPRNPAVSCCSVFAAEHISSFLSILIMGKSLFEKVWDAHTVRTLSNGQTQLFIGTHLIHEVTSPQAFGMLRDLGLKVAFPNRTFATVDHIIPTNELVEPYADPLAQAMMDEIRKNCAEFGITFFELGRAACR